VQEASIVTNIQFHFSVVLQQSLNVEKHSTGGYVLTATTLSVFRPLLRSRSFSAPH